jgi:hypothetical protein
MRATLQRISAFLKVPVSTLITELKLETTPLADIAKEGDPMQRRGDAA